MTMFHALVLASSLLTPVAAKVPERPICMSKPTATAELFKQFSQDGFVPLFAGGDLLSGGAMALWIKKNGDWLEVWSLDSDAKESCVVDGGSKLQPIAPSDSSAPPPANPPTNPDPQGPHLQDNGDGTNSTDGQL